MKKAYLKVLMGGDPKGPKGPKDLTKKPEDISKKKTGNDKNNKISTTVFTRELDFETLHPKGVQIMFMSEEEIEKLSVIDVKKDEREERAGNFEGTISDNRMYPNTPGGFCSTCFLPKNLCPGHLGRISLVQPIINIWAYKFVVSVLETICHECGTLLMNIDTAKRYSKSADRLRKIAKDSKNIPCRNKNCPNRDQVNPSFIKKTDNMLKIQIKYSNNKVGFISSSKIYSLFNSISSEELEALGFPQDTIYNVHPKNLLFTKLPVIPLNHRPNVVIDGETKKDSITNIYHKIIEVNNLLKSGEIDDKKSLSTLEDYVCSIHFRDSETSKLGNPNVSDTSKNVSERLSRKKGLIRSHAMANRCDHTGRTVIGPGGLDIPFGYIRLPHEMKKILVTERICDKNLKYYEEEMEKGNVVSIETRNMRIKAENRRSDFVLKKGMIVHRKIQEGDPIIFNRNPTLHKHSMMGYLAKFSEGLTIGLHSSCTTPHNADFDGDEGNFHSCPGYLARAEIINISGCWNNVIGSQFSRPMMGLVFNAITSAYLMSDHGVISDSDWDMYINEVFRRSNESTDRIRTLEDRCKRRRPNDTNWKTGPALFSALLPENFYYSHDKVEIKDGILVKGLLTKNHVGPSTQSIVHMLYYHYGTQVVSQFISEGQNLMDTFIERRGFTIGYRDCAMPADDVKVKDIIESEMKKAQEKLQSIISLKDSKHPEEIKFYNDSVQAALDSVKTIGIQIAGEALKPDNTFKIMSDCKSKGKVNDISQVIGIVGQQFLRDRKRPPLHFNRVNVGSDEGLRFLPYYDILHEGKTEEITSRGFVDRPLGKGMRPGQFFAHMMASRLGLIDTALGTATTGYSQHYITKALEDMRYSYNGTICNDLGKVIQYAGGGDSYEPKEMAEVTIPGYGKIWSPIDIESYVDMLNNE